MKNFGSLRSHLVVVALLSAIGCGGAEGPELGYVSGTVTMDGQPVGAGYEVEFVPHTEGGVDGRKSSSSGTTDDSGVYVLKYASGGVEGAELGKHGVVIINAQEKGLAPAYSSGEADARAFWVTVESGSQVVDIPLESNPSPGQVDLEKK